MMQKLLIVVAVVFGMLLAYIDTRPNWDDMGVLVAAIVVSTAICGFIRPDRTWLWALAIGGWVPACEIAHGGQFASLAALGFGFAGALAGAIARKSSARAM